MSRITLGIRRNNIWSSTMWTIYWSKSYIVFIMQSTNDSHQSATMLEDLTYNIYLDHMTLCNLLIVSELGIPCYICWMDKILFCDLEFIKLITFIGSRIKIQLLMLRKLKINVYDIRINLIFNYWSCILILWVIILYELILDLCVNNWLFRSCDFTELQFNLDQKKREFVFKRKENFYM